MPRKEGAVAPTKRAAAKKAAPPKQEPLISKVTNDDVDLDSLFAPLGDVKEFINACMYGREGSGKTTNACRMANLEAPGKVLVINAEGGLKMSALRKRGVDVDRIEVWPNPKNPMPFTHRNLNLVHQRIAADLTKDPDSWVGVIIDSASDIYIALLDVVQKKRVEAIRNQGKAVDEDFVDISDYGTMSKLFRDIMRKFRDLPCHVVITALERRDVDRDTGKPQYGPAVTPGLQTDLLGYVDFVLMCKSEDEDGPYRALTRANSRYRAKDRFDVLPRVTADPYFDRLFDYLAGNLVAETDPLQELITDRAAHSQDAIEKPDDDDEETDETDDSSS